MYVKWEGVQGEKTRGGGVKESTFPRTGMRRGGGGGASVEKWYPFHISSLEHCICIICCKCTVFLNMNKSLNQEVPSLSQS